jgi:hypothetical protein
MNQHVRHPRGAALPPSCPPRGLRREEAAAYVGVSPSKFDDWVKRRVMPGPKRQDACVIWDRLALDVAFAALPDTDAGNPWDDDD